MNKEFVLNDDLLVANINGSKKIIIAKVEQFNQNDHLMFECKSHDLDGNKIQLQYDIAYRHPFSGKAKYEYYYHNEKLKPLYKDEKLMRKFDLHKDEKIYFDTLKIIERYINKNNEFVM